MSRLTVVWLMSAFSLLYICILLLMLMIWWCHMDGDIYYTYLLAFLSSFDGAVWCDNAYYYSLLFFKEGNLRRRMELSNGARNGIKLNVDDHDDDTATKKSIITALVSSNGSNGCIIKCFSYVFFTFPQAKNTRNIFLRF